MVTSPSGIAGLDQILHGGLPAGRPTVVIGGPGCGKTVLAMQFLISGAASLGEPGLMISFEESPAALRANLSGMTWPFEQVIDSSVHLVDGRLPEDTLDAGSFDLHGLIAVASSLVRKHGIRRIAVDGIDALFAMSEPSPQRRRELQRLLDWLRVTDLTTILTIKGIENEGGFPGFFGLAEYAADSVISLRTKAIGELARRTLLVVKTRGAGFDGGEHPYVISDAGIRVLHTPTRTRMSVEGLEEHLSSGVERLDRMLAGGYRAGTTTLISGLPGTSKTTLCAAFLDAGCRAGERGLFVGFDEPAEQMIADVRSVGIDLETSIRSKLLRVESFTGGGAIGDEHFLRIEGLIDAHNPKRVVIDPVTALEKSGGKELAGVVAERLVALFKSRGISAIFTAVSEAVSAETEAIPMRVSTIADTWIYLSFANRGGERNRTLTIVKARGTAHSNQMRELLLSADGLDLADVYLSSGDVLVGAARAQRERQDALDRTSEEEKIAQDLDVLDREREDLAQLVRSAERTLAKISLRRAALVERVKVSGGAQAEDVALLHDLRHGDPTP